MAIVAYAPLKSEPPPQTPSLKQQISPSLKRLPDSPSAQSLGGRRNAGKPANCRIGRGVPFEGTLLQKI